MLGTTSGTTHPRAGSSGIKKIVAASTVSKLIAESVLERLRRTGADVQ